MAFESFDNINQHELQAAIEAEFILSSFNEFDIALNLRQKYLLIFNSLLKQILLDSTRLTGDLLESEQSLKKRRKL